MGNGKGGSPSAFSFAKPGSPNHPGTAKQVSQGQTAHGEGSNSTGPQGRQAFQGKAGPFEAGYEYDPGFAGPQIDAKEIAKSAIAGYSVSGSPVGAAFGGMVELGRQAVAEHGRISSLQNELSATRGQSMVDAAMAAAAARNRGYSPFQEDEDEDEGGFNEGLGGIGDEEGSYGGR